VKQWEEFSDAAVEDDRCTPELLLAFIQQSVRATGKYPTWEQTKERFGGILSAQLHLAELNRKGLLPRVEKRTKGRA